MNNHLFQKGGLRLSSRPRKNQASIEFLFFVFRPCIPPVLFVVRDRTPCPLNTPLTPHSTSRSTELTPKAHDVSCLRRISHEQRTRFTKKAFPLSSLPFPAWPCKRIPSALLATRVFQGQAFFDIPLFALLFYSKVTVDQLSLFHSSRIFLR